MKSSNIMTMNDIASTLLTGAAQGVAQYGMDKIGNLLGESKSVPPRNTILNENRGNRQRVFYGPGGGGRQAPPNLPPGFRRRGARRRGRRGRGRRLGRGQGGGGPTGPSSRLNTLGPVTVGGCFGAMENSFISRGIRSNKHGPGTSVAFSSYIADIRSNNVTANGDLNLPIVVGSVPSSNAYSGFQSVDTNQMSGYYLHPFLFGSRMNRESANWQGYVWKWLRFSYVPSCPTSTSGMITLAMTRDPDLFIEAGGTQTAPKPSYSNLSQTIPFVVTSLYQGVSFMVRNRENVLMPIEFTSSISGGGNNMGQLAYNRTYGFGRLAALFSNLNLTGATTFGQLWVEGVIEFYQPSASQVSIGTTYATNLYYDKHPIPKIYNVGLKKWFESPKDALDFKSDPFNDTKEHDDRKVTLPVKSKNQIDTDVVEDWETSPLHDSPPVTLKTGSVHKFYGSTGV